MNRSDQGRGRPRVHGGAVTLAVLLAAVVGAGTVAAQDASAPAGGTVKVGFISPVTGFVSALGIDMRRGWSSTGSSTAPRLGA